MAALVGGFVIICLTILFPMLCLGLVIGFLGLVLSGFHSRHATSGAIKKHLTKFP